MYYYIIIVDMAVTLTGEESYITLTVNTQLLLLGDKGSISLRTTDTNGILFSGIWYLPNGNPTNRFVTVEVVNGMLSLKTILSDGKDIINVIVN